MREFTPDEIRDLRCRYVRDGVPISTLAALNGVPVSQMHALLVWRADPKPPSRKPPDDRPAFTPEQVAEIGRRYTEDQVHVPDLAHEYRVSHACMREVLTKDAGVTIRKAGTRQSRVLRGLPLDHDSVVARWRAGESMKSIQTDLGTTFDRVKRILDDAGETSRSRPRYLPTPRRVTETPKDHQLIILRFRGGESRAALARRYGIDRGRITRILMKAGEL